MDGPHHKGGYEDRRTKEHRHPTKTQSLHGRHIRHPYAKRNRLSEVDARLPFTYEIKENGRLPFLDVLLIREPDGSLSSTIYRKESNTGLTIDPRSSQNPTAWIGVFKGVSAHHPISETEIKYLINNFEEKWI